MCQLRHKVDIIRQSWERATPECRDVLCAGIVGVRSPQASLDFLTNAWGYVRDLLDIWDEDAVDQLKADLEEAKSEIVDLKTALADAEAELASRGEE